MNIFWLTNQPLIVVTNRTKKQKKKNLFLLRFLLFFIVYSSTWCLVTASRSYITLIKLCMQCVCDYIDVAAWALKLGRILSYMSIARHCLLLYAQHIINEKWDENMRFRSTSDDTQLFCKPYTISTWSIVAQQYSIQNAATDILTKNHNHCSFVQLFNRSVHSAFGPNIPGHVCSLPRFFFFVLGTSFANGLNDRTQNFCDEYVIVAIFNMVNTLQFAPLSSPFTSNNLNEYVVLWNITLICASCIQRARTTIYSACVCVCVL